MIRRPPRSTRTDTRFPYTTLFRSLRFIHGAFFGPPPTDLPRIPHEPPRWMLVPVALLVLACLVVGIVPGITVGPFLATAVSAVLSYDTPSYSLRVWHGFTIPLMMSALAMEIGRAHV